MKKDNLNVLEKVQENRNNFIGEDSFLIQKNFNKLTKEVSAPVMFWYVWWVIKTAQQKEIKTLYFLARDGFILHRIAKKICNNYNINIECRYLYCSRIAWRTPSYHFIGDEAYSLIFSGGYKITPYILLNRVSLSKEEREFLYKQIGYNIEDENKVMSKITYELFAKKLWNNNYFRALVKEKSKDCYKHTMGYLSQEGLTNNKHVAIVDTGWTGSMQRTLRQLLDNYGVKPKITGFYFGMYEDPKSREDGEYLTWCFNKHSNVFDVTKFNNNILECMCISQEEMTVGYTRRDDKCLPIFKGEKQEGLLNFNFNKQLNIIDEFVIESMDKYDFNKLNYDKESKIIKKKLRNFMYKPTKEQANACSLFEFCDDMAEPYLNSIIRVLSKEDLSQYNIFKRFYNKFFNKKIINFQEIFWPYGSLEVSNLKLKWLYRLQFLSWDIWRYIIK